MGGFLLYEFIDDGNLWEKNVTLALFKARIQPAPKHYNPTENMYLKDV